MERIDGFHGDYRFLSNFHPVEVELNGVTYPSVEHAYQASKTLDGSQRDAIRRRQTAGQAKKMGQGVKLRRDWNNVKVKIMEHVLRQKFEKDELKKQLLATGDAELIEGNTWGDNFWGMVKGHDGKFYGKNNLGRLLMKIRQDLRGRNILV
jgi:ribA/ribD-fused uncharacterized protein